MGTSLQTQNLAAEHFGGEKLNGCNDYLVISYPQAVETVGQEATERFDKFQAEGNYSEGYFTHGLAVQTAEASAEYLHRHIRREPSIPEGQGKRYSWGYPAIPELQDHRKVFDLLPAERELVMSLTSAYQLVPEQSTAAIVLHHPQAKYFSFGESRVEQLMKKE